jgi:hypothetical protein
LTNQRSSVIVFSKPGRCISTHRTLNQLRGLVEMGLIHFPTTIPFSGKAPKKFRCRKVRCIKQSSSVRPEDELLQSLRAYICGAEATLCMVNLRLKAYIARQESLSNGEHKAQRGYPSVAKAIRLRIAIEYLGICLKPVMRSLGMKPYGESAEYKSESALA